MTHTNPEAGERAIGEAATAASLIDTDRHPIAEADYRRSCRNRLNAAGALVLTGFARPHTVSTIVKQCGGRADEAFYAASTHNVYLTDPDPSLDQSHPFNRQVASSKGLLADDQIPSDSPLRTIYDDSSFRAFIAEVFGIGAVHPYADAVSSINVHFAADGMELGWHFDNSSFAVTMLLQATDGGARFEFVPDVRDADRGDMGFETVAAVLDGAEPVTELAFEPGDLVLFRGRDALHRVTPTEGDTTRVLVVFAYNTEPGIALSSSALATFYGRDNGSVATSS